MGYFVLTAPYCLPIYVLLWICDYINCLGNFEWWIACIFLDFFIVGLFSFVSPNNFKFLEKQIRIAAQKNRENIVRKQFITLIRAKIKRRVLGANLKIRATDTQTLTGVTIKYF